MTILITGSAGFIGFHTALNLLKTGVKIVGIDNLNDYYSVQLKKDRLAQLEGYSNFSFHQVDIANKQDLESIFQKYSPTHIVHLAAQAGVRYSLTNPDAYIQSNIVGFTNLLEAIRANPVEHLVYASSSSVYGNNNKLPFHESDQIDRPASLYAATKKANELMAYTYSHLYQIPSTGLRFFTVYGPWGRPDMSPFLFVKSIIEGSPIKVFNHGNMSRDFTYIDDIVNGIVAVLKIPPTQDESLNIDLITKNSTAPYRLLNIGNNKPIQLTDYISAIENELKIQAHKEYLPMQPGDMLSTYADTNAIEKLVGFKPNTSIQIGMRNFIEWYRQYNGRNN